MQIAGLTFDVAASLIGVGYSADLVVIGDMAADGERKVLQQVEGRYQLEVNAVRLRSGIEVSEHVP